MEIHSCLASADAQPTCSQKIAFGFCVVKQVSMAGRWAAMLDVHVERSPGIIEVVSLKSWHSETNDHLRWELKRMFRAAGYDFRSQATKPCSLIRKQLGQWHTIMQLFEWQPSVVMGLSRRACQESIGMDRDECQQLWAHAEAEYWVSTPMMIMVLFFWSEYRKELRDRSFCYKLWTSFLKYTVDIDFLKLLDPHDMVARNFLRCRQNCEAADLNNMCTCAQGFLGTIIHNEDAEKCPYEEFFTTVRVLWQMFDKCLVAAHVLQMLLQKVGGPH